MLLIGAATTCWVWWRRSRADPTATMSANRPDVVPSNRTDDDQRAIDIDNASWVWSSSSPSLSLSLTSSSAADSWCLSDDPSTNGSLCDGSDDCSVVSDDRVEDSVTLDADADADADGSEDTLGSTFAFAIDVDWSHGNVDDDCDDSGRMDEWPRHPEREDYDGSYAIAAVVPDHVRVRTGTGHSHYAVGPVFDVGGCGCGVGNVECSDGDGDDAAKDGVFSNEALFNDAMIRQRTPPFNS